MKKIPLTQGKYAIVDDSDFEWLNSYKWCASKSGHTFYAVRRRLKTEGPGPAIIMHRAILGLGPEDKQEVDHKNHNGLYNRRNNLRACTSTQNHQNKTLQKNGSSIYKGVSWDKFRHKWHAHIRINGHAKYLGYFVNEIEAAQTYDEAARKYFGEFACCNFKEARAGQGALFE